MKTKTMGLFLFTVFLKTHTFGFIYFCYEEHEEHKILNSDNTNFVFLIFFMFSKIIFKNNFQK